MAPSRLGQRKLVQAVSERHALSPRRVFLRKVDLTLSAELGTPQAHASLQGPQICPRTNRLNATAVDIYNIIAA